MSKNRRSIRLEQPPVEIIRGAQVLAEYLTQEVPQFRGNPLNEALPLTLIPQEVTEYLLQLPPYSDKDREMSQVARLQMTETAREFFVPNGKHLTVYYAITNMIRRGYVRRNPVLWEYWKRIHLNIESFLKAIKEKPFPNSRARGLAIVGTGGTGKSTTVEKILQSLPQVITHASYKGQDFIMKQLVWLKLDCPRKGSLRELCVNFFRAVDEILGTEYEKRYAGSSHRTLEALITGMARVAANQCLGVIVIDEIQDLSEARSGGEITMINFFVHLENALGVPFSLIGTQDAIPLLSGQFRQARRVSEQGYIAWDRMSEVEPEIEECEDDDDNEEAEPEHNSSVKLPADQGKVDEKERTPKPDPVWKNFIETLWIYQYIKQRRPLKENVVEDKCAHALYRAAKGIPAVVQTIFVLAQQLAILTEEEKITPRLINETVRTNQHVIKEMLSEARMKTPRPIMPVGDLTDLDQIYEAQDNLIDDSPELRSVNEDTHSTIAEDKSVVDENITTRLKQNAANTTTKVTSLTTSTGVTSKLNKRSEQKRENLAKNNIRSPANHRGGQTKNGDMRKKDKYSRSPDEYIKGK